MESIYILIDCIGRGGAEKIAVTLANELTEQGHEVHLLILRRNIGYELNTKVKLHVMSDLRFARGYGYSALELIRGFWWVLRTLQEQRRESRSVLVSHLTRCNLINIALEVLMPRHRAVCVSHNSIGFYKDKGLPKRALLTLQGLLFPLAHRTVCVSKRMAADYQQFWLFRKNSIVTIYNPVTLPIDMRAGPASGDPAGSTVHIAMVGRLHPVKRHDLAIQAMAVLKRRSARPYVLHLVGDGPEEQRIRSMVDNLGVDDRVVLHGWLEDTKPVLMQCAMGLLCSDTEGFPNSIVESLALGIPVVATDCVSGPRELLAPDLDLQGSIAFKNGFLPALHGTLVQLGDAAALANAIEYQAGASTAQTARVCAEFAKQFASATVARQYSELVAG